MAGPVFVRDSQGTPLMPLAHAHARRLLQSGKAHILPHYLFTIVQLTRVVEQPILRPVLLGVVLHRTVAELFLLAEGTHAIFPLLYVVVDLQIGQYHRLQRSPADRAGERAVDTALAIGNLLALVPITSTIILAPSSPSSIMATIARRLVQYLQLADTSVLAIHHSDPRPSAITPALYAALLNFIARPTTHATPVVARTLPTPSKVTQLRQMLSRGATHGVPPSIGIIDSPPSTGIVTVGGHNNYRTLCVAVSAGRLGVTWRHISINAQTPLKIWPVTSVAFLPIAHHQFL